MTRDVTTLVPQLLKRLYDLVTELEAAFPGRPFTPDGRLSWTAPHAGQSG